MDQPIATEEIPINRMYSMRLAQIARLSDLARRFGKDQSTVLREAIDAYYEAHKNDQPQPVVEADGFPA